MMLNMRSYWNYSSISYPSDTNETEVSLSSIFYKLVLIKEN